MQDLRGTNAILTGASKGLGVHIAEALAGKGVNLALAARSKEELDETRDRVAALGVDAVAVPTDVGDPAQVTGLVQTAELELGTIDILVNNAGIDTLGPYAELPLEEVEGSVRVNLLGPMLLTRLVLPGMVQRGRGHVVNVASLAGRSPIPFDAPYGGTKAGLIAFTRSLRMEYDGTPIRFSVVEPGFVAGGMFAKNRELGFEAPGMLGVSEPGAVAEGVIRALERDDPEVIVNPRPVRPALLLAEAFPRSAQWVYRASGQLRKARRLAEARQEERRNAA